jgi:hypothetical protein
MELQDLPLDPTRAGTLLFGETFLGPFTVDATYSTASVILSFVLEKCAIPCIGQRCGGLD